MPQGIWLESVTFSDGSVLNLGRNDVVVIVGPNNAGKSAALRGIHQKVHSIHSPSPVVKSINIGSEGSADELIQWLENSTRVVEQPPGNFQYQTLGAAIPRKQATKFWTGHAEGLQQLAPFFCRLLNADERLRAANPAPSIAITQAALAHPIHYLQKDDSIEKRISEQFRKAFGDDLIVHRNAGSEVPLYIGSRPIPQAGEDRVSAGYLEELEKLQTLHSQGDVVRSFAGVLLNTSVGHESILLVDEPEAFLHPPQARLLGQMLVEDKQSDRQLFIATHSGDILKGVLNAGGNNVRVVRLKREGGINVMRQLDNARISELWNDPLLRYSDILDGIFHEKVVVTEGDADARFYSAIAESIIDTAEEIVRRPSIKFVHCGGKARLPLVVRALSAVDVPVIAVSDFDVLNSERPLKDILEAANGDWSALKPKWKTVKDAIESKKPDLTSAEVKEQIGKILDGVTDATFPESAKTEINRTYKKSTPWANAKETGKAFVPSGDPSKIYDELIRGLRQQGVFVVEVGELEKFYRKEGNHGPAWVNAVLSLNLAEDPDLAEARAFVNDIISWTKPGIPVAVAPATPAEAEA